MLHVVTKGTGQPVVLLHGFSVSHNYWNHVLDYIPAGEFKVTMPDLLGFGRSHKPDMSSYSADEHAQSVVSHALDTDGEPVILVGHSMGAMVATRIAKLYPNLISKLVLINMPLFADQKHANQMIMQNLPLLHRAYVSPIGKAIHATKNSKLTKTVPRVLYPKNQKMQDVAGEYLNHTRVSLLRSLHNTIIGYQPLDDIRSINTKTKVVFSRDDRYFSKESLDLLKHIKHVETIELSGGHQLPLKQAPSIGRIIIS